MSTLERAIEIAREAHLGQRDKAGNDYINHPLRVMEMWHDGASVDDLAAHFGRKRGAIISRMRKLGV